MDVAQSSRVCDFAIFISLFGLSMIFPLPIYSVNLKKLAIFALYRRFCLLASKMNARNVAKKTTKSIVFLW